MSDVVIATWLGGGATRNALRIGRELAQRGHAVRVLAPARFTELIRRLGCEPVAHPPAAEFDPSLGRALDDQEDFMCQTFFGPRLANAVRRMEAQRHPDVIVVDYLLRSVLVQAEALGLTTASLVHMASYRSPPGDDPDAEWGWRWQYQQINGLRSQAGLSELPVTPEVSATLSQASRAARVLVTLPRELDSWASPPDSVIFLGAINESRSPAPWHSPWPPGDDRPLIVVSFGTTYMHQEDLLERVFDALAPMSVRTLALTGDDFDPAELSAPPAVKVQNYVPHESVLPHARLVIHHGGMGTLLECLRAGVPSICIPLGRDQHDNAHAAEALGVTTSLGADATSFDIGAAVRDALDSPRATRALAVMADTLARYGGAEAAADEIEKLVGQGLRHPARPGDTAGSKPA
jgi:MGT family glycosyltransferase